MTMLTDDREMDPAAEGAQARLSTAWHWLCEQRASAPEQADVWDIRWQHLNAGEGWLTALEGRLVRGTYRLSPLQLHGQGAQRRAVWGAQDALVLKWVALSLQHLLPLHPSCEHVKGHGGGKPSIETLHGLLTDNTGAHDKKTDDSISPSGTPHYRWVCRTDIRGYYRNIRKETLMQQVRQHVISPVLRDLVHQYLHYTVEDGGTFQTPEKGISRGCPLSPLMGALHLHDMDAHFSRQQGIHYARYMDDVIILATSRWSLRKQTKQLMQWFSEYGFEAHPDKTFIGRTEKGFDWMGAWLTHEGVTDIAPRAKANHREKVRRLYERLARVPFWKRKRAQKQVNARVSAYRLRWNIWAAGVLCTSLHVPAATLFVDPTTPTGSTLAEWQLPAVSQESPVTNGGRGPDPVHGQNQGRSELRVYATIAGTLVSPFAPGRQNVPGTPYYGYPIGGPQSRYWMVFSMTTGNAAFYTGTIRNDVTDGERTCTGTLSDATGSSTYGVPSWNVTGGGAKTQPNITYECAYYGNPVQGVTMQASCNPDNTCNNAAGLVRPHISLPGITARIVYTQQGTTTSVSGTGGSWAISWAQTAGNQRYGTNDTQYITAGIAAIATTGVTCAISSSGGPPTPISTIIHSTSPSTANTIAASGTVGPLSVNCSGASDPGSPVINVGYQIKPSAGTLPYLTRADAVQSPTDTGYYLTLHTDAPSCTNNSKSVRLDGTTVSLGSIPPGGSGSIYSDVNPLNYALCSTGAVSSLGSHTISLLATSVMY